MADPMPQGHTGTSRIELGEMVARGLDDSSFRLCHKQLLLPWPVSHLDLMFYGTTRLRYVLL